MTAAYSDAKMYFMDIPMLYGFADNMRFRGADGIYLFNWFDRLNFYASSQYQQMLDGGLSAKKTRQSERRYPVCFRNVGPSDAQLPKETDNPVTVRILMGATRLESETATLVLGFEKRDGLESAIFSVSLNGKELGAGAEEKALERLGSNPARAVTYSCPLGVLRSGENEMILRQTVGEKQRLVWAELRVVP